MSSSNGEENKRSVPRCSVPYDSHHMPFKDKHAGIVESTYIQKNTMGSMNTIFLRFLLINDNDSVKLNQHQQDHFGFFIIQFTMSTQPHEE